MMFHLPYFNMPYYGRYSRYGYHYPYYNCFKTSNTNSYNKNANSTKNNSSVKNMNICSSTNEKENKNKENSSDSPLFQLFGINLYFDDILLICLIWFLYDEGVKDEGLFIALILLLLS